MLADAAYGKVAEFRAGVRARGYQFVVGVMPTQQVYPAHVRTHKVRKRTQRGRPFKLRARPILHAALKRSPATGAFAG